ncbi:hypothetical protein [Rodentibacter haemolyticus]|uniref:Uncharacterized protein n=1 Tax=Rodentibacter haemolyticus TaxID=2778911 RepID=A0ABX6V144_9PAST|nr:hypothetical protein [Rodentibacter haemolyticus]QPB43051.1 hypothetical protein IHV77_02735 [Rodentibacter haemolyticus]
MKTFNLEQALQGKPVRLACGAEAYIFTDISNLAPNDYFPLIGGYAYEVNLNDEHSRVSFMDLRWSKKGELNKNEWAHLFNIVGMWEE